MKTLSIEDDLAPQVIAALAGRAKYFEHMAEDYENGHLPAEATERDAVEWKNTAARLWVLVGQF